MLAEISYHGFFENFRQNNFFIRVRPPKDFGPKAQNLEGVRTSLRKCGMDINSWKKS